MGLGLGLGLELRLGLGVGLGLGLGRALEESRKAKRLPLGSLISSTWLGSGLGFGFGFGYGFGFGLGLELGLGVGVGVRVRVRVSVARRLVEAADAAARVDGAVGEGGAAPDVGELPRVQTALDEEERRLHALRRQARVHALPAILAQALRLHLGRVGRVRLRAIALGLGFGLGLGLGLGMP